MQVQRGPSCSSRRLCSSRSLSLGLHGLKRGGIHAATRDDGGVAVLRHPQELHPAPWQQAANSDERRSSHSSASTSSRSSRDWADGRSPKQSWLTACVTNLVRQLADSTPGPALQLVRLRDVPGAPLDFITQELTPGEAQPEAWPHLARQISAAGASAVVLARPIAQPQDFCPVATSMSSSSTPGNPAGPRHAPSSTTHHTSHHSHCTTTPKTSSTTPMLLQQLRCPQGPSQGVVESDGSLTEYEGLVDVDDCCGGVGPAAHAATHGTAAAGGHKAAVHAPAPDPHLVARAQQLLRDDIEAHHLGGVKSSETSSSSSSSSSSEDDELLKRSSRYSSSSTYASLKSGVLSPEAGTPLRSRRRFLRRQQLRMAAAAAATAAQEGSSAHSSGAASAGNKYSSAAAPTPTSSSQTSYWGLVVQTVPPAAGGKAGLSSAYDGCYVLKTSRNQDLTGCTCVAFSLTHVCSGTPLAQQLQEAWLAQ